MVNVCATKTIGTDCCHESSIGKVRSNAVTENVSILQDILAVGVKNLCAGPGILTQDNCQGDDTNGRFCGNFYHKRQNVQSVKNCENCVVHL